MHYIDEDFIRYTWLDRASDERQYCSPGVDLPIASIMRSKYKAYPEYHTSLDDLTLVTARGLAGGFTALQKAIDVIENNATYKTTIPCEPQLGKRGLYPTLSSKGSSGDVKMMMNLISFCDGTKSLLEIADILGKPFWELLELTNQLTEHDLLLQC